MYYQGNILIDEGGNAVLCDFGLSRMRYTIERSKTMIRFGANRRYMAPELPDPSSSDPFRSDEMSDVYSLALTLYHLRVLEPPFADLNDRDAAAYARLGNRPSRTRSLAQSSDGRLWGLFGRYVAPEPRASPFGKRHPRTYNVYPRNSQHRLRASVCLPNGFGLLYHHLGVALPYGTTFGGRFHLYEGIFWGDSYPICLLLDGWA